MIYYPLPRYTKGHSYLFLPQPGGSERLNQHDYGPIVFVTVHEMVSSVNLPSTRISLHGISLLGELTVSSDWWIF
jgi:hypothetical protein